MPLLAFSATQTNWASDINAEQNSGAVLENGIKFNHVTTILLSEKFINVDFLVPFPQFELDIRAKVRAYIETLGTLWTSPSWQCHFDYSIGFQNKDSTFDIDWLLHQVESEVTLAEQELIALRNYTSAFSNYKKSGTVNLSRPLGACITRLIRFWNSLRTWIVWNNRSFWILSRPCKNQCRKYSKTGRLYRSPYRRCNEKFFMVTLELAAMKSVQKEMIEVQNRHWQIFEEHFEMFRENIRVLRDCDQLLFSRQQKINVKCDTISFPLAITFANVESYRGALYLYQINMMNST